MASGTLTAPAQARPGLGGVDRRREHRCECGNVLRVFGGGRHRVYFKSGNARLDDPMMDGTCPQCGRELPGKKRS